MVLGMRKGELREMHYFCAVRVWLLCNMCSGVCLVMSTGTQDGPETPEVRPSCVTGAVVLESAWLLASGSSTKMTGSLGDERYTSMSPPLYHSDLLHSHHQIRTSRS